MDDDRIAKNAHKQNSFIHVKNYFYYQQISQIKLHLNILEVKSIPLDNVSMTKCSLTLINKSYSVTRLLILGLFLELENSYCDNEHHL